MPELTDDELGVICELMPDAPERPRGGCPRMSQPQGLRGIFWVLDNGAKWKDLPRALGAKSTVHRTFQRWVEEGAFEALLRQAGRMAEEHKGFKLCERCIDGNIQQSQRGRGWNRRHEGRQGRQNHAPGRCPRPARGRLHQPRQPA